MNRPARQLVLAVVVILSPAFLTEVRAETETIDLKALAKKARPAVMLLVVSDADGKEIATGTGFLVSSDGKLITNHHVIEAGVSLQAYISQAFEYWERLWPNRPRLHAPQGI